MKFVGAAVCCILKSSAERVSWLEYFLLNGSWEVSGKLHELKYWNEKMRSCRKSPKPKPPKPPLRSSLNS